jgi:hypothetical protein
MLQNSVNYNKELGAWNKDGTQQGLKGRGTMHQTISVFVAQRRAAPVASSLDSARRMAGTASVFLLIS